MSWQGMETAEYIDGEVVQGIVLGATCVMEWSDAYQGWFYAYTEQSADSLVHPTAWAPLLDPE